MGDGWSTVELAESVARTGLEGSRLFSIDISPESIAISRETVPGDLHPWVTWITDDAQKAIKELPVDSIDLLYLDSSDDPRQILSEFEAALPKLGQESIVLVDDTGPYHAGPDGKGTLVLPRARKLGWKIERRDDEKSHMSILTRASR
jgi:predicted O-methyltransferase YrrM